MFRRKGRAPRIIRFPVALAVGYGSTLVAHRFVGLPSGLAWLVGGTVSIVILTVLSRTIYRRLGYTDTESHNG